MRYAVIQLTQNCESYYQNAFLSVHKAITRTFKHVVWFFVENDSTDKTVEYAQQYGHVLSLSFPKKTVLSSRCTMRTEHMAHLRNLALQWVHDFGSFDFIIWLDTNVTFSTSTALLLKRTILEDDTIGLVAGNTTQHKSGWHYYDTYALNQDRCLWKDCDICNGEHSKDENVDVASAFGGLCIIRNSIRCSFAASYNQCEHVYMCAKIWEQGYRVVVVGHARGIWTP